MYRRDPGRHAFDYRCGHTVPEIQSEIISWRYHSGRKRSIWMEYTDAGELTMTNSCDLLLFPEMVHIAIITEFRAWHDQLSGWSTGTVLYRLFIFASGTPSYQWHQWWGQYWKFTIFVPVVWKRSLALSCWRLWKERGLWRTTSVYFMEGDIWSYRIVLFSNWFVMKRSPQPAHGGSTEQISQPRYFSLFHLNGEKHPDKWGQPLPILDRRRAVCFSKSLSQTKFFSKTYIQCRCISYSGGTQTFWLWKPST